MRISYNLRIMYVINLLKFLILFLVCGCASNISPTLPEKQNSEMALPEEFKERFNVKDVSETELSKIDDKNKKDKKIEISQTESNSKKSDIKKSNQKVKKVTLEIPNRRPKVDPIHVGEKLYYDVTYLGMSAGDFTLEVKSHKVVQDRKVYHIHGLARSSKIFSLIYKIEDTLNSYIDYYGIFSHRFELNLNETKQQREALELHDHANKKTFYWDRWNHYKKGYIEKKEYAEIIPFSQDPISSLYYVRTLPLKVGDQFTFPVVSEAKNWEAVVTVVRKEELNTEIGRVKTIVIKPQMKFEGIIKQQGDSFIWLTDDDRRFMVRVEAKVKIGYVVGSILKIEPGIPTAE